MNHLHKLNIQCLLNLIKNRTFFYRLLPVCETKIGLRQMWLLTTKIEFQMSRYFFIVACVGKGNE